MSAPLQPPTHFSFLDNFAHYFPTGEHSLEQTVEMIDGAIRYCRENKVGGLLVDISGVTGFPSPTLTDRFWFITKWAESSDGRVVLAIVTREEMIDPDRMGITIANNRGLQCEVFTSKVSAFEWLAVTLEEHEVINISSG
jgi:hypothetical protein